MHERQHAEQPLTTGGSDTADDLAWAGMEISRAQRQIARGVSEFAEGIVSLSLVLLEVRRRRLYRFDPEFPTFEAYVAHRHGISADQARTYVDALLSLGEANYRALVSNVGVQRTYALAMLKQTDPALLTAFQALPAEERRAVTVGQIAAVDQAATAQVRGRVAQLEREITREQGLHQQTRRRLQEIEELHQRVTSSLIEERDSAQRGLDQEQAQTERLRGLLAEARRTTGASAPAAHPPAAARPDIVTAPTPTEAVVVVVTCDVPALVTDIHGLSEKLRRLVPMRREEIAPEQRGMLAKALTDLDAVVADLLDVYADA